MITVKKLMQLCDREGWHYDSTALLVEGDEVPVFATDADHVVGVNEAGHFQGLLLAAPEEDPDDDAGLYEQVDVP